MFLPQALLISKVVISTIEKIQKQFIWKDFRPKINFRQFVILTKKGGLKNVDISSKIRSLQCWKFMETDSTLFYLKIFWKKLLFPL